MPKVTLEHLGRLVKEKRGSIGLRETARQIGVSAATLSRVESGLQPDLDTFSKLCQWLQIDPGEVLGYSRDAPAAKDDNSSSDPFGEVALAHFRAEAVMRPETAVHLGRLILAVQRAASKTRSV